MGHTDKSTQGLNCLYLHELMRLFIIIAIIFPFSLMAQTIAFEEDFENGTGAFSGSGNDLWETNDSLVAEGSFSLHNSYQNNSSNRLTLTGVIDLSQFTAALLEFKHIAKIEISDAATIEISSDGGSNWTMLNNNFYQSSGFLLNGNQFFDGSYTDWEFNNFVQPDNSWWKTETFNITSFISTTVKIRFTISADASLNYYGWLIDDLKVIGIVNSEVDPPVITHTPITNTGSTDPLKIEANISDASGIDSAQIFYRFNGGTWIGPMEMFDKSNGDYEYNIPGQIVDTEVDYYMRAIDGSLVHNIAKNPSGQSESYHTYHVIQAIASYPYLETFETASVDQWINNADLTVGNTGVVPVNDWELGLPSTFFLSQPWSGTNAYATQLTFGYSGNSRSSLLSPVFDLSSLTEGTLTFFHKFLTDFGDGCRVDYISGDFSTVSNNQEWKVLGDFGDAKGHNWYNNRNISSASDVIIRPGWSLYSADLSGANQDGWLFSTYNISDLVGPDKFIRFRFVFTSLAFSFNNEGWLLDDVSIDNTVHVSEPTDFYNGELTLGNPYPNPANDQFNLPFIFDNKNDLNIRVYNTLGELVYTQFEKGLSRGHYTATVPVADLSPGIYNIQVELDDAIYNHKLTVVR